MSRKRSGSAMGFIVSSPPCLLGALLWRLRCEAVIFLQDITQAIVRERFDAVIVPPDHGLVVDQRIDDRFLSRLHHGGEDRVEEIVRHSLDGVRRLIGIARAWISGGESEEQIAGAISGNTSGTREAEAGAPREAFELAREKRCVGCDDDDNGAGIFWINGAGNFFVDRNARDRKRNS